MYIYLPFKKLAYQSDAKVQDHLYTLTLLTVRNQDICIFRKNLHCKVLPTSFIVILKVQLNQKLTINSFTIYFLNKVNHIVIFYELKMNHIS